MALSIKWLKDKAGEKFFPKTHTKAVVCDDNTVLSNKLEEINQKFNVKMAKYKGVSEPSIKEEDFKDIDVGDVYYHVPDQEYYHVIRINYDPSTKKKTLEWEKLSDSIDAVSDITINGTSIIKDGVGEIPIATGDTQYGLYRTYDITATGVTASATGTLMIYPANTPNITARKDRAPITPTNLVYAVKSVVTSQAETEQLSAEEQANAKKWLGVSDSGNVKINGVETVDNNIPIASSNELGLLSIGSTGLSVSPAGKLSIVKTEDNLIDSRNTNSLSYQKALTLNGIDYAVKSAMCDGKGAEWTEQEQANARARLGIYPLEGVEF